MDAQKLLETLQELEKEEIESFKWQLRQRDNFVGGLRPLKPAALEDARNRERLVNLIIGKYTNDAQEIVMKVLREMGKYDLADDLANIPKGVDAPGKAADSKIVTDQQLMQVANNIGKAWRRIGILLGISGLKLEQIEENHPRDHGDRVYQMLTLWKRQHKKNATAAQLHAKLTELGDDLVPDDIDSLLGNYDLADDLANTRRGPVHPGPVQSIIQEDLRDDRYKLTTKATGLSGTRNDDIFEKPEYNRPGTNQDTDGLFLSKTRAQREDTKEDDRYKLTSKPGLCVIIDNENFKHNPNAKRRGSKKDAVNLAETFSWLGFRVLMFKDLTMSQMQETLELFSSLKDPTEKTLTELQKSNVKEWSREDEEFTDLTVGDPPQHRDAFVCCIMSHGEKGSVFGTDFGALLVDDITTTFNGKVCPVLLNKPKVFFIQACQGTGIQCGITADSSPGNPEAPKTPVDADFLVFMATTENNKAFRSPRDGSWFIQSLCKQLKEGSRDKDLMAILTAVNKEMADKKVSLDQVDAKLAKQLKDAGQEEGMQMSVIRHYTLRRSLRMIPQHPNY